MEIIPAIDLRQGKVVHLYQGDYGRETVYSADPLEVARQFETAGAARLHIVDLDGAQAGSPQNALVYQQIAREVRMPLQVGGGLRTLEAMAEVIAMGADRVVLGTTVVSSPQLVEAAVARYGPDRVVAALDARNGLVAVKGWTEGTSIRASDLMAAMTQAGVGRFIYTAITRDGTLTGPDFEAMTSLVDYAQGLAVASAWQGRPALIASGGVGDMAHLERLATMEVEGAIVGTALYAGKIDLASAIRLLSA